MPDNLKLRHQFRSYVVKLQHHFQTENNSTRALWTVSLSPWVNV